MVFKVAIIGGGVGGLALAHALMRAISDERAKELEVVVYEQRDEEGGMQQYPIHLDPDGREALRGILSEDDYAEMVKRSAQGTNHGGVSISTPGFKRLFQMRQQEGEQPQFIHRWLLREFLSEGVDVKRARKVVRVENVSKEMGKAEIIFDDDTSEKADLVVGADGVGSALRGQLYPSHAEFARLPYINIQMKLTTTVAELPKLLDANGINIVLGTKDYSLLLVPFHAQTPSPGTTDSGESPVSSPKRIIQDHPQFLFAILAILTIHTFDGWQETNEWGWQTKIVKLLQEDGADEHLIRAFKQDIISGTVGSPWQVVRCDPDRPVPYSGGNVILIGDAVHAMPPQAGAGASTALLDAYKLSQVILASQELEGKSGSILSLLPGFHREMMNRANQHVKDATRRLYLSNRSGWGVYTQRATLRMMDNLWPAVGYLVSKKQ